MTTSPFRQPTAVIPLILSLLALLLVVGHFAVYGIVHEADEGAAAHIFQLLIAVQVPIIAFFAFKWMPRAPGPAIGVLALQAAGVLAAFAAVYFLT